MYSSRMIQGMNIFCKRILLVFILTPSLSLASDLQPLNKDYQEVAQYSQYITIDDGTRQLEALKGPYGLLEISAHTIKSTLLSLLKWTTHNLNKNENFPDYDRRDQFGNWINDPTDDTCYNTRTKILIRDSITPVRFSETNRCRVVSGKWIDPYTGQTITDPRQLQIDHVVPLKNAYLTGAWSWNYQKRCLYANFVANDYHLLAVSSHENMSKGDRNPSQYSPPSEEIQCGYVEAWLKIKMLWKLKMTPPEAKAIQTILSNYNCDRRSFVLSERDLEEQREMMSELLPICKNK